ncbi:hypothetical protein MAR_024875, partial [Mya arenaria]
MLSSPNVAGDQRSTHYVSWKRANESYVLTIGTQPMTSDPRFEVAHIEDSPDWNMMISNVTTTDSGMYNNNRITLSRQNNKTVITVQCVRGSTPPESTDWFKDRIKIVSDGRKRVEMRKKLSINSRTITSILILILLPILEQTRVGLQVTSVNVNDLNKPDDAKTSYTLDSGSSASQMVTFLKLVSFCLTQVAFVRFYNAL